MIVDLKTRLLEEAKARLEAGDYANAIPLLEKVTRFARTDVEVAKFAHVSLAAHWFEQGDPRSVEHFRAALRADPSDDRVRYCLGHAHLDAEQWEEAVIAFESALELRHDCAEYLRSLGVALTSAGRQEDGIEVLREAAKRAPSEPFVLKDLAQALVRGESAGASRSGERGGGASANWSEALRLLRRAVSLAPDEPIFQEVLEETEHLHEAEQLAGAVAISPRVRRRTPRRRR